MKNFILLRFLLIVLLLCCVSRHAEAQDLKSILSGVVKTVVGDKATTSTSIVGTWQYSAPDCCFESDNLLAQAGGEVAAAEVESRLASVYKKIGLDNLRYTFNEDGTYSYTVKKISSSGTYTFDENAKTITMTGKLGIKTVAHVTTTGSSMSLVFDADKLMTVLKTLSGAVSKVNSTASTLNSIIGSYDGLLLGFEMAKQ